MSEQTQNGVVDPKKAVWTTEAELRMYPAPETDKGIKLRGYKVGPMNGQYRYTYAIDVMTANSKVAKALGVKAVPLDKVPTAEETYAQLTAMPPDELKALLARVNASATIAGDAPTANPAAHKAPAKK